MFGTALMNQFNIGDVVTIYNQARLDLDAMIEAQDKVFQTCTQFMDPTKSGYAPYELRGDYRRAYGRFDREILHKNLCVNFWASILYKLKPMMPAGDAKEIDKQIEACDVPEFNEAEITKVLIRYLDQGEDMKRRMIESVFNFLTPSHSRYKTNQRAAIKKKAVIAGMVWAYGLNSYRDGDLEEMNKVFHLLDGQGVPQYPNTMAALFSQARSNKQTAMETDYFSFKWLKNNSLHVTFKRMDLVNEINRTVGASWVEEKRAA